MICNNVEDARRFAEILKEKLPDFWDEVDVQDYMDTPTESGYRAVHVNFRLNVGEHLLPLNRVPCEVQIRSWLQDAWAELSHDDIYKQPDLPEDLRARSRDLAEVLAAADRIASGIRSRVMRETGFREYSPEMGRVSDDGLAHSFRAVFGRSPPDYTVRQALNLCDQLQIVSLEGFPEVLDRPAFRDRVADTYRAIMGIGFGMEEVFFAAMHAFAKDDDKAIAWVRRKARRERDTLEQYAKLDLLSSLPATLKQFLEAIEGPHSNDDIVGWAEAFGATADCAICSTIVVEAFSFAEAAAQHYNIPEEDSADVHQRIETALDASGVEIGGWGDGSLCGYHNDQMERDD